MSQMLPHHLPCVAVQQYCVISSFSLSLSLSSFSLYLYNSHSFNSYISPFLLLIAISLFISISLSFSFSSPLRLSLAIIARFVNYFCPCFLSLLSHHRYIYIYIPLFIFKSLSLSFYPLISCYHSQYPQFPLNQLIKYYITTMFLPCHMPILELLCMSKY